MMTRICFCLLVPLIALVGCGGPKLASVEGTVTMDGEPLPNASVVFSAQGSRPAGAMTDENGHYVLNFTSGRQGAIPGSNRVMISTAADPSETEDGKPIPAQPETVPSRYNSRTELLFEVIPGKKNIADFALSSEGPIDNQDDMILDNLEGDEEE